MNRMGTRGLGLVALAATFAMTTAACVYESDPSPSPSYVAGGANGGGGGSASTPPDTSTPSATPILVQVDPDKTLSATAGAGVGVFVEYRLGGHWNVWWTCDTSTTGESCAFDVKVSVSQGAITNVANQGFASADAVATPTAQAFEATTTTTTNTDAVTFDTAPGAVITLEASVGGQYFLTTPSGTTAAFIFFSQDGQVNGGYQGLLTNPLELEGSSP
jgi:hypothetical protein